MAIMQKTIAHMFVDKTSVKKNYVIKKHRIENSFDSSVVAHKQLSLHSCVKECAILNASFDNTPTKCVYFPSFVRT